MRSNKLSGFTLAEMLVSVAIIALLAVVVVVNMDAGKRTEQLKSAAQVLSADLRTMQSKALSAGTINACPNALGVMTVCESSTAGCSSPAACQGTVPSAYGVYASSTATGYMLFAEVDPSTVNYRLDANEILMQKQLLPSTSPDVTIQDVLSGSPLVSRGKGSISFMRQSGTARMDDGTGLEPTVMVIRLVHKLDPTKTLDVEVNRVTGRISVL